MDGMSYLQQSVTLVFYFVLAISTLKLQYVPQTTDNGRNQ